MRVSIFLILIILFSGFLVVNEAKAGAEHNVWGWAWAENIGWTSFNSTNCDSDSDGITDQSNYSQCSTGNSITNYGVNVDSATGLFSGYAWSDNIGWISFNRSETGAPPSDDPCLDGSCTAKLDPSTYEVSGWARAMAYGGGWDGWIKLRGTWEDGVLLDTIPDPKEFEGYAWGSDVVGWISFNDRDFDGSLGLVDYQVMTDVVLNNPPTAIELNDNETESNYCNPSGGSMSAPPIFLNWTFNDEDPGDTQSAYQIQIDDSGSGFPSPEIDTCISPPGTCSPGHSLEIYAPPGLSFGTTYYWRLKVWDSNDAQSDWIDAPSAFTTDVHRWPNTKFTPDLINPPAEVEVTFTDESICYDVADSPDTCQNLAISYEWDFEHDGSFDPTDWTEGNTTYTYSVQGNYTVRLEVTDDVGMCPYEYPLTATVPLPIWKEIPPF